MTRETIERRVAQRNAHAIRTAVVRLMRERAGKEVDPALAYGCVDWFLYDTSSPPGQASTQVLDDTHDG